MRPHRFWQFCWQFFCASACWLALTSAAPAAPRGADPAAASTHPVLQAWRDAVANSYLGVRAGIQFYPSVHGASEVSGYSPMPSDRALTLSGDYRSELELSGFGTFVLGTNYGPNSLLRGRLRQEYEFGYRSYENRACFRALPDDATPGAADNKAEAQALLDEQLVALCPRQSDYVWTFMLNTHYDVPLGRLPLALHTGFGLGYLLAVNRIPVQRLADDGDEPWFDGTMLRFGEDADEPEDDSNPRFSDTFNTERANNTELSVPNLVESGLFIPIYAGVSWRTDSVSGLPLTLDVLYRYAALAPRGFQDMHALSWGVRYRF